MTAEYKINISEHEIKDRKSLKILAYFFIILFLIEGSFSVVLSMRKGDLSLLIFAPFALAAVIYLNFLGKWVSKKFVAINKNGIQWTTILQSNVFVTWSDIKQINFKFSRIIFLLNNGKQKQLSLSKITIEQIRELKQILKEESVSNQFDFISNSGITEKK